MLEIFIGSKHALNAPEWTQWSCPTPQFQQPRASFAALFGRMALWDVNRDDVIFFPHLLTESPAEKLCSGSPLISNDSMGAVNLGMSDSEMEYS